MSLFCALASAFNGHAVQTALEQCDSKSVSKIVNNPWYASRVRHLSRCNFGSVALAAIALMVFFWTSVGDTVGTLCVIAIIVLALYMNNIAVQRHHLLKKAARLHISQRVVESRTPTLTIFDYR
jgi:hypothetical protein